jgi:hypothetical protein
MVDPTNWFSDDEATTNVGGEAARPGVRGKIAEPEPLAPPPDGPPGSQVHLKSDPNLTPLTPEAAVAAPFPRPAPRAPQPTPPAPPPAPASSPPPKTAAPIVEGPPALPPPPVVEQPTPIVETPAAIVDQSRPPEEVPTPVVEAPAWPVGELAPPPRRRRMWLAFAAVPMVVVAVVTLRPRAKPPAPASNAAPAAPAQPAAPPPEDKPVTPEPSAPVAAPTPAPTPVAAPTQVSAEPARARKTLGGKRVVLEYDPKPTSPTPPPATAPVPKGEDPAVIEKARIAYHRGNNRLFGGDVGGAEAAYRETLTIYPGYVSGYRGLGLAYERAGKNKEALEAFRVYLRTVPTANDAELIRQRVARLEKKR